MINFAPPWADKKWHDEIAVWIQEQIAPLGYTITSPFEAMTVNQWDLSCVLRVPTDQGDVFFKAVVFLPGNANEAALLPVLSKLFSEDVPTPLAVEPEQCWMLLPDIGQDLRSLTLTDASLWKAILQQFATLQIQSVGLFADVVPNQALGVMAAQIETLIADKRALSALDDRERKQLRQGAVGWIADCEKLAQGPIPLTLVHGDLHRGNIAIKDGVFRYFDWTEASISHPFFDLFVFLNDAKTQGESLETRHWLRDVYLSQWTQYADMDTLRNVYEQTVPLAIFYQAFIYNRIADALIPTPDAIRSQVGAWLRKCL